MRSDAELLARFAASGDEAAFAEIAERHGAMVYRVCLRLTRDPHEAEDAAQGVFMVLARRARSLKRGKDLAGWLHGVARNAAHWSVRARARRARRKEEAAVADEARGRREVAGRSENRAGRGPGAPGGAGGALSLRARSRDLRAPEAPL